MLHIAISLRAIIFVVLLAAVALTGSDSAQGAPSAVLLTDVDGMVFTATGQNGARDIRSTGNNGGIRIYNSATAGLANPPTGAAIQFFGNNHTGFPGQAFIDSGAHTDAAIIFRTAGTGGSIAERARIDAQGRLRTGGPNSVNNSHCNSNGDICAGDDLTADRIVWVGNPVNPWCQSASAGDVCAASDVVADGAMLAGTLDSAHCQEFFVSIGDICAGADLMADNRILAGTVSSGHCDPTSMNSGDVCAGDDLVADDRVWAGTVDGTNCNSGGDICAGDDLVSDGDVIAGSGCVRNGGGGQIAGSCDSDVRLKQNIEPLPSLFAQLAALQPVTFHWRVAEFPNREFGEGRHYGLIAQDVESVLPELVTEQADGYKAVHYERLPMFMLQGMRGLKAENDALREQNASLEARLAAIEQRLNGGTAPLVAAGSRQ